MNKADPSSLPKGVPAGAFAPIHLAARNRDAEKMDSLLRDGVDPNLCNRREPNGDGGNTPLWFAAQGAKSGGVVVAELLLATGADIHARCEYGTTALHTAVAWAHLDMVRFLITHGADTQALDDEGRSPLDMARADFARAQDRQTQGKLSREAESWLANVPPVIDFLSAL